MRKKLLSLLILVLLTIGMLSALNLGPAGVSAADYPSVYVDPESTPDGPMSPSTYTIEIWTDYSDGLNITGYQFSLTYNPLVLQGVAVAMEDGILSDYGTLINGTFDNDLGKLSATVAYYLYSGYEDKNGPGKLATVIFNVVGDGDSNIILGSDTQLKGWDRLLEEIYNIVDGATMPFHLGHGYFANLPTTHDVAVTNVTLSAINVFQGDVVTIDVTVENQGDVPETFDVTVWTGILALETKPVVNLPTGTSNNLTLPFNWNTTGYAVASYTIVAVASTVAGETEPNTADNTREDGIVTVNPAITAAFTAEPTKAVTQEYVAFDAGASSARNADIVLYEWDFGREIIENVTDIVHNITGEVVGRGDGNTTVFSLDYAFILPGETIYIDGTIETGYVLEADTGVLTFASAPEMYNITDDVGVGDGNTTVFSLDYANVSSGTETIYIEGVPQTKPTDYSINYISGTINFTIAPETGASITANYLYGVIITADYISSVTVEKEAPLIYNSTEPTYEYKYPQPGIYGVWLWVTDNLNRTSTPTYGTIEVICNLTGAYLTQYQVRLEAKNWYESSDYDGLVKLTALVYNYGDDPIRAELEIAIFTANMEQTGDTIYVNVGFATTTRELVGVGNGTTTEFSLDNTLVVPGTETIYVAGVVQTRETDYEIDYETGIINFTSAPGGIANVTRELVGVGNGTTTEFSLDNTPVVPGTETIKVRGVVQTRETDYEIDYETGIINFTSAPKTNSRIKADYDYVSSVVIKADYEYELPTPLVLPVGENVPIYALLNPYDYGEYDGSKKVKLFAIVTLWYDEDGDLDPHKDADAPPKTFSFTVQP